MSDEPTAFFVRFRGAGVTNDLFNRGANENAVALDRKESAPCFRTGGDCLDRFGLHHPTTLLGSCAVPRSFIRLLTARVSVAAIRGVLIGRRRQRAWGKRRSREGKTIDEGCRFAVR